MRSFKSSDVNIYFDESSSIFKYQSKKWLFLMFFGYQIWIISILHCYKQDIQELSLREKARVTLRHKQQYIYQNIQIQNTKQIYFIYQQNSNLQILQKQQKPSFFNLYKSWRVTAQKSQNLSSQIMRQYPQFLLLHQLKIGIITKGSIGRVVDNPPAINSNSKFPYQLQLPSKHSNAFNQQNISYFLNQRLRAQFLIYQKKKTQEKQFHKLQEIISQGKERSVNSLFYIFIEANYQRNNDQIIINTKICSNFNLFKEKIKCQVINILSRHIFTFDLMEQQILLHRIIAQSEPKRGANQVENM